MLRKNGVLDKAMVRDAASRIRVVFSRVQNAAQSAESTPGTDNAKAQVSIIGALLPQLEALIPVLPEDAGEEEKVIVAEWKDMLTQAQALAAKATAAAAAVRESLPPNFEKPHGPNVYQKNPNLPDVMTFVYCTDRPDARPVVINDNVTIYPNKPIELDQRTFRKAQGLFRQCIRVPEGLFKTKGPTFLLTIEV